ncbi:Uncharacterized protein C11orf63 [Lonchura striata]|uniref:Uncharacterized protein C11orf63 n=1 Tax=Lonchura striata TaxID=40157 RepID=A0A218UEI8_9PASE|nr:Uncharacterized protein C11orf63 [Lonchura striata domestica]
MNPSNMKYISVSSPPTYTTNNIDVPPKILMPPVFQPASWERERSSASSLEDSQDSDSDSQEKERQYQLALLENQELVGQDAGDILEDDVVEEDSLEEMSSEEKEAEYDTKMKGKPKIYGSGRVTKKPGLYCRSREEKNVLKAFFFSHIPSSCHYLHISWNPVWMDLTPAVGFPPIGLDLKSEIGSTEDFLRQSIWLCFMTNVTDPTPVVEEPLQNFPAFQTGKMKSEDKRYPKGQQLKEQQHEFYFCFISLQRNKTESQQPLSGRGKAFPRSDGQEPPGGAAEAKPRVQQTPEFQAAPPATNPNSSPGPAEKSQSGLNNFPNSILTTPASHFLPIFQNFYPAEVLNPEYGSKEDKKHQQDSPAGIPHQFPASAIPGQGFSRNKSDQAHPELGNISSDFNAIFQEKVKDQAPLPDFKNHIHEDNRKICLLFGFQLGSSKFYFNLSMKLGGLGPDYETIKEKKEKLKLQKEYSRQIKEYNMKNITVLQRFLPVKPQVSPGCRHKALEYAKKIPRPKTFIARQPEQEVKEAVPQAPAGTRFPKIPSLESLWSRHEKEKEVVAAFKALHIL